MKLANHAAALPQHASRWRLPFLWSALTLAACGGVTPPTVADGALEFLGANIQDGQTWTLDGPIELRFTQPIDFASVSLGTFEILDAAGLQPLGAFTTGIQASGLPDPNVIRFVPACPELDLGSGPGLRPDGTQYTITVRGSDSGLSGIVSTGGFPLERSVTIGFQTPRTFDPSELFHDPLPTPASVVIRGAAGVGLGAPHATHVEIGNDPPSLAYFRHQGFGSATFDTSANMLLPNGLPLNHRIDWDNRVRFLIHFDQPIEASDINVGRVGLEYLNGTWKRLRGRSEIASNCEGAGYAVRFIPEGLLPRGTSLRIAIDAGLRDRAGQQSPLARAGIVDARTTNVPDPAGAPSDGIFENFFAGGDEPTSIEDTDSNLPFPRAFWNDGALIPQPDANGMSMAQSKWVHIGYGKIDPGMPDRPAQFFFDGVDATGAIEQVGGVVTPVAESLGPIPLVGLESGAVSVDFGQVPDPVGLYLANPALFTGSRANILPGGSSIPGATDGLKLIRATLAQNVLRLGVFQGCFIPGFGSGDCVPLNLLNFLPGPAGLSVQIVPQSFEVYRGFALDRMPPDSSVRILFDGAMAGPDGEADPTTALSLTSGWTSDLTLLSSAPWDFVRFQVLFDLDASGDGWSMTDGLPVLNFIKLMHDHGR